MRVLLCTHNFPPEFVGGVERVADMLANDLCNLGHEVHVFTGSAHTADAARIDSECRGEVSVHRFVRRGGYSNLVDTHDPVCEEFFDDLLTKVKPDVVHVHHWFNLSNGLVARAARRGIPSVCTLHDFWSTCTLFFRLPDEKTFCELGESHASCVPCVMQSNPMDLQEMEFSFDMRFRSLEQEIGLSRAVIVNNRAHAGALMSLGRFKESLESRIVEVPLGATPMEGASREGSGGDQVVLAHWGNLARVKGLLVLVRAAAQAANSARFKLKILGEMVDVQLMEEIRNGIGDVELEVTGRYESQDLPQLLADADVAVFPSLARETHSLVVDEALMLGLPVVVSDRGALPDRVGSRGMVVQADDEEALSAALDQLADPAERAALTGGNPGSPPLSSVEHAGLMESVYKDAIAEGAPDAGLIRDLAAHRLEFRNQRLQEIHKYVLDVEGRRENVEQAIKGDADALERLRVTQPEVAARIESILAEEGRPR